MQGLEIRPAVLLGAAEWLDPDRAHRMLPAVRRVRAAVAIGIAEPRPTVW